jgi:hypothetical protein
MTVGGNKKKIKAQKSKKDSKAAGRASDAGGPDIEGKGQEQAPRNPDDQPYLPGKHAPCS